MLRVMSTFSGISAASVAWKPLGMEFAAYSEVDSFACHVLSAQLGVSRPKYLPSAETLGMSERQYKTYVKSFDDLPLDGIPNFGDITQITDEDLQALGHVDVLEGGSPCQAFSIAGLREGLNDIRGNLMLEFSRLNERMKQINGLRFVIWENVKGVLQNDEGRAFGCLLASLTGADRGILPPRSGWRNSGVASKPKEDITILWRVLDARFFGLPHRRERVFVAGCATDRRKDFNAVLFERRSVDRLETTSTEEKQEDAISAETGVDSKETITRLHFPKIIGTLLASAAGTSRPAGVGSELDFVVVQDFGGMEIARRLLPIECERLQGFPDDWTNVSFKGKPAKDADRYRATGNSMAVPCMKFIGVGLLEYVEQQRILDEAELISPPLLSPPLSS